jgi:hypothetical protein
MNEEIDTEIEDLTKLLIMLYKSTYQRNKEISLQMALRIVSGFLVVTEPEDRADLIGNLNYLIKTIGTRTTKTPEDVLKLADKLDAKLNFS